MSKERLESLKRNKEWTEATGEKFYTVDKRDYEWLIEQAELVGYFARKNGELNEFLNKYIEPKHLGKNVIDVAMDIIVKQAERVQELEKQNYNLKESTYKMQMDFIDANKYRNIYKEQNKRYRKAIENIKKYNQKALKVDDYTKNEALLDISLEIMKLEGEVNE